MVVKIHSSHFPTKWCQQSKGNWSILYRIFVKIQNLYIKENCSPPPLTNSVYGPTTKVTQYQL